jgi:hypothetical protein
MLHGVRLHRVPWGRGYATWCTPTQGTMGEGLCYMVSLVCYMWCLGCAYTGYHGGGYVVPRAPGMLHVVAFPYDWCICSVG